MICSDGYVKWMANKLGDEITIHQKLEEQGWLRFTSATDGNCLFDSVLRGLVGTKTENLAGADKSRLSYKVRHAMRLIAAYKQALGGEGARALLNASLTNSGDKTTEQKASASIQYMARDGQPVTGAEIAMLGQLLTSVGYKVHWYADNINDAGPPRPIGASGDGEREFLVINTGIYEQGTAGKTFSARHYEYYIKEDHEFITLNHLCTEVVKEYARVKKQVDQVAWAPRMEEIDDDIVQNSPLYSEESTLALTVQSKDWYIQRLKETMASTAVDKCAIRTQDQDKLAAQQKWLYNAITWVQGCADEFDDKLAEVDVGKAIMEWMNKNKPKPQKGTRWTLVATQTMVKAVTQARVSWKENKQAISVMTAEQLKQWAWYGEKPESEQKLEPETDKERALLVYVASLEKQLLQQQRVLSNENSRFSATEEELHRRNKISTWYELVKNDAPKSSRKVVDGQMRAMIDYYNCIAEYQNDPIVWRYNAELQRLEWRRTSQLNKSGSWSLLHTRPQYAYTEPTEQESEEKGKVKKRVEKAATGGSAESGTANQSKLDEEQAKKNAAATDNSAKTVKFSNPLEKGPTSQSGQAAGEARCFFHDVTRCRNGSKCKFAHKEDGLTLRQRLQLHPIQTRPPCAQGEDCGNERCIFSHPVMRKPVYDARGRWDPRCWAYISGRDCKYGNSCRFSHSGRRANESHQVQQPQTQTQTQVQIPQYTREPAAQTYASVLRMSSPQSMYVTPPGGHAPQQPLPSHGMLQQQQTHTAGIETRVNTRINAMEGTLHQMWSEIKRLAENLRGRNESEAEYYEDEYSQRPQNMYNTYSGRVGAHSRGGRGGRCGRGGMSGRGRGGMGTRMGTHTPN